MKTGKTDKWHQFHITTPLKDLLGESKDQEERFTMIGPFAYTKNFSHIGRLLAAPGIRRSYCSNLLTIHLALIIEVKGMWLQSKYISMTLACLLQPVLHHCRQNPPFGWQACCLWPSPEGEAQLLHLKGQLQHVGTSSSSEKNRKWNDYNRFPRSMIFQCRRHSCSIRPS